MVLEEGDRAPLARMQFGRMELFAAATACDGILRGGRFRFTLQVRRSADANKDCMKVVTRCTFAVVTTSADSQPARGGQGHEADDSREHQIKTRR